MKSDLRITRAIPNPIGKDKTPDGFAYSWQLEEESFDFANQTDLNLSLDGVSIWHETFDGFRWIRTAHLGTFLPHVVLPSGWSLRVHTGSGTPHDEGFTHHSYLNRESFVLNNEPGDRITLCDKFGRIIDQAWYAPYPPEGEILFRTAA